MTSTSGTLPCIGHSSLYDIALFDHDSTKERAQAIHQAAALCARCPSPCEQKVTADSAPVELVLLDPDWMPPAREGKPEPEPRAPQKRRQRDVPLTGREYVKPDRRVAAWARMAAERAALGHSLADIAEELCVTENTVAQLLDVARQRGAA